MNLTEKQTLFVHHLVNGAASASEACRMAGYEGTAVRQQASQMMRKPHIQKAVREEQFRRLNGNLANIALTTLENVMLDENAPYAAKVSAAIAVLERSGIHHNIEVKEIEKSHKAVYEMSKDELIAFMQSLKKR